MQVNQVCNVISTALDEFVAVLDLKHIPLLTEPQR